MRHVAEVMTPSRLSWSSVSTYAECGQRWLLERGHKVPTATWFATIAGSVIHNITEERDRLQLMGFDPEEQVEFSSTFETGFVKALSEAAEEGREVKPSGRKLKEMSESGGPDKKDKNWWLHFGPIFLERWMTWKQEFGWEVLVLNDGTPCIELKFEIELGGEPIVGFIDRGYTGLAGVTLLDLKTGTMPTGSLQLKTYDLGMKRNYGISADWGMFWTPGGGEGGGKLSQAVDLKAWSDDRVEEMYASAMRGIKAGVFLPHVTAMCRGCTVRDFCWAVAGERAEELPAIPVVIDRTSGEVSTSPADAQV